MMLYVLLGLSMLVKDVLSTLCMAFVARDRRSLASLFDTLGDWANLVTIGFGGATAFSHGFGWDSVFVMLSLGVGSQIGTRLGMALSKWLETKLGTPVSHRLRK